MSCGTSLLYDMGQFTYWSWVMIIRSVLGFVRGEDIMLAKHAWWQVLWVPGATRLLWLTAPGGLHSLPADAHWESKVSVET